MDNELDDVSSTAAATATASGGRRGRNSIISSIIKSCNNNTISDENMNVRSNQNEHIGRPIEHLGNNRVGDNLGSNLHEFNLEPLPFTDYSLFEENYGTD